MPDPVDLVKYAADVYRAANAEQQQLRDSIHDQVAALQQKKLAALRVLHTRCGLSYKDIGGLVDLSAPRIGQLLTGDPARGRP